MFIFMRYYTPQLPRPLSSWVGCFCGALYRLLQQPYRVRWTCSRCGRKMRAWSTKNEGKGLEHETARPRI